MNADEKAKQVEGAAVAKDGADKAPAAESAAAPPPAAEEKNAEEGGGAGTATTRLYVGNLPWSVTSAELRDHMSRVGEVLTADVLVGRDGRSRGCGVVEYATGAAADRAVDELQDTEISGRRIFVREDREEKGAAPGTRTGGAVSADGRSVAVANLPYDCTWQDLKDHMRRAGDVVRADVRGGAGRGTVLFVDVEGAQTAARTLNGTDLMGRAISVVVEGGTAGGGPPQDPSPATRPPAAAAGAYHEGGGGGDGGGVAIYVGNLAYETSWQDLKDHMCAAGPVERADVLRTNGGRSKGCGIVVYEDPESAARAIRDLQDTEVDGRRIFVREDREAGGGAGGGYTDDRGSGRAGSGRARGGGRSGRRNNVVLVGNVGREADWQDLKDHFRQCGSVARCDIRRGNGMVRFGSAEEAAAAAERMDGTEFMGRVLECRLDQ